MGLQPVSDGGQLARRTLVSRGWERRSRVGKDPNLQPLFARLLVVRFC